MGRQEDEPSGKLPEGKPLFLLSKPSNEKVSEFLASQNNQPFSYIEVGMTQKSADHTLQYKLDHNRVNLGSGSAVFERAVAALKKWRQFDLGWVEVWNTDCAIEKDAAVVLLVPLTPLWIIFSCRIVYVIDETDTTVENTSVKKFGFAYGTMTGHPEAGEERFTIEWHQKDDSVWYDILAVSRPGLPIVKLGMPFARLLQKRFARDSMQAMARIAAESDKG